MSSEAASSAMAAMGADMKCPCCDNPWARATGDLFAQMCGECATTTSTDKDKNSTAAVDFGLSRSNMDWTMDPSLNFYQYANGTWMQQNPIPTGYPNWNSFLALHVQSQERCQMLLQEITNAAAAAAAAASATSDKEDIAGDEGPAAAATAAAVATAEAQKVATFYQAALDEEAIEAAGATEPLRPMLAFIEEIVETVDGANKNPSKLAQRLGQFKAEYGTLPTPRSSRSTMSNLIL